MFHRSLKSLIKKHLDPSLLDDERIHSFLSVVNDSFLSFDRYRDLLEHSFKITEREFEDINSRLSEQSAIREKAIKNLIDIARQFPQKHESGHQGESDDLIILSDFISDQIQRYNVTSEELKKTVKLFKTLLDNFNSAVLVENEERKILFTNENFCDLFKINYSPDQLIGFDCSNSAEESKMLFKDQEGFVSKINEILENRIPIYDELLEMADGTMLERDYVPIYVNDVYKGHLWKYENVTEKLRNLRQIEESNERNKLIMSSAIDAIIIIDSHGKIIYWNPSSERIFGWKESEVAQKLLSEVIIPPSMRNAHEQAMKRRLFDDKSNILGHLLELPALHKEGYEFLIEIYIICFEQDGEKYYCSFIKDISERKNNEIAIKLQEEKYRNIIANMNLGLLEVDLHDVIIYANQSFCEMSGYSLEELRGKKAAELLVKEEHKKIILEKNKIRKDAISDSYEIEVYDKNGKPHWWFLSGAPNYNDKGQLIGSIGIHLDITEQKRLSQELAKAKSLAEAAGKAKELFLANMSHEIRTPLNVIIGMIRQLTKEDLTKDQHFYVKQSESSAKHLLTILNNVLDVAKIESGDMEIISQPFSPSALAYNVHSIMYSQAKDKNLEFKLNVSPDIRPVLIGDDTRLRQVLINLIGNSIKFTDKGSIHFSVELMEENDLTQRIKFEVRDTGIGMSEEFISKIFDKFSQEHNTYNRKQRGTGLGMAISNDLIKLMGGIMQVQSIKNSGTLCSFELNLLKASADSLIVNNQQIKEGVFKGKKALLVEDNEMNRFIAIQSLNYLGFNTTEAENGLMATELAASQPFDLILMDIQMPIMDGVEATIFIREKLNVKTPIIALTANAFKHDIDLYLQKGMNDFITKPYDEQDFFRKIDHVISLFESTEKLPETGHGYQTDHHTTHVLYNLNQLKTLSRGDEAFVSKMTAIFVNLVDENTTLLESAIDNENFETLRKIIHKIKPSVDQMGIESLHSVIRKVEKYDLHNDPKEGMIGLVQTIIETLRLVVSQLK